jgi:hypothetical protein
MLLPEDSHGARRNVRPTLPLASLAVVLAIVWIPTSTCSFPHCGFGWVEEGRRERGRKGEGEEGRGIKGNVGAWIQALAFLFFCKSSTRFVHLITTATRKSLVCSISEWRLPFTSTHHESYILLSP